MPKEHQDMSLFVGLIIATAVNHLACGFKIWRKKRRIGASDKKKTIWTSQQQKDPSLLDHKSSCMFALLNCMFAPAVGIFVGYLTGFPKVGMKAAMLTVLVLVMPLSIYARKPHIRTTLARELKDIAPNL